MGCGRERRVRNMERIKKLNRFQKGILLLLAVMMIIFTAVYGFTVSRVGFLYQNVILIPSQENGDTCYSGKISGEQAVFTVKSNGSVTFAYGSKEYGPYTVTEDLSAVPKGEPYADRMTGIIVRDGEVELFRGGVLENGIDELGYLFYTEDGWDPGITITAVLSDGTEVDSEGNIVDPMEPDVGTILSLVRGPELTHKGQWTAWIAGVFLSVMNAVLILYAEELFHWSLSFRIRDAYAAEPSDWEMTDRYVSWTALSVVILMVYVWGLKL